MMYLQRRHGSLLTLYMANIKFVAMDYREQGIPSPMGASDSGPVLEWNTERDVQDLTESPHLLDIQLKLLSKLEHLVKMLTKKFGILFITIVFETDTPYILDEYKFLLLRKAKDKLQIQLVG